MWKLLAPAVFTLITVLIAHTLLRQGTFFTDELIIQETANNMIGSGDFVSPRIEGMVDFAKPPFVIWMTSLFVGILGPSLSVVRLVALLVSGVSVVVFLCIVHNFKVLGNRKQSLLPLIVVVSPIFWLFAKNGNFDTTLSMFAGLAFLTYHLSLNRARWWLVCCLVLAASLLTRSFLALPFIVLILAAKLKSDRHSHATKTWTAGLAIMLVSVIPWHLAAFLADPGLFIEGYIMFPFTTHLLGQGSSFAQLSMVEYLASAVFLFPLAPFVIYACWKLKTKIVHFNLLALWLGLYIIIFILLAKNLWYLPILTFPYSLLALYGITTLLGKRGVPPLLTKVYVCLTIGVFVLLNIFPVPANGAIEAIKHYEALHGINGVLYVVDRNYFPKTSLFPDINIEYIEGSALKTFEWSEKAVLIKSSDIRLLNGESVHKIVETGGYSIVTSTI